MFKLDPAPDQAWYPLAETLQLTRTQLDDIFLRSFVKSNSPHYRDRTHADPLPMRQLR